MKRSIRWSLNNADVAAMQKMHTKYEYTQWQIKYANAQHWMKFDK